LKLNWREIHEINPSCLCAERPAVRQVSACVKEKRMIALNLESVEISLQCDMLSNLNAKTDNQVTKRPIF
jgi:hypothetical protein